MTAPIALPANFAPPAAPADLKNPAPVAAGINPASLGGLVVDDAQAKLTGNWSASGAGGLTGYVGTGYRYRSAKEEGAARYEFQITTPGRYEVRLSYGMHENRATNAPVKIESADGVKTATVNQKAPPPLPQGFVSLGIFPFAPGKPAAVTIGAAAADGTIHADAVQLVPVP